MLRLLTTVGAIAVLVGAGVEVAQAGTYTQNVCRAAGAPAPADGFSYEALGGTAGGDRCAAGGSLGASLPGKDASSYVRLSYKPPSDTKLVAVYVERFTRNVNKSSNARYEFEGTTDACDGVMGCPDLYGTFTFSGELAEAAFRLSCPSSGCAGAPASDIPELFITSARLTLRDDLSPVITVAPTIPTDRALAGTETFSFEATDRGGGVFEAELVVDGVSVKRSVVDENGGLCRPPFVRRVPCKLALAGAVSLDTTKIPDGEHTIALNVYDATGTNVATHGPVPVRIANGSPAPASTPSTPATGSSSGPGGGPANAPAGDGATAAPVAASGTAPPSGAKVVGQRSRSVVRTSFARPLVLRGRLLDASGAPLAGTQVGAYAAADVPGARSALVVTATTDADGAFRIVVPPGPSRRISVRPTAGTGSAAWNLRTRVPAPIALLPSRRRLRNGDKLVLTAYLVDARAPRGSADVAFQVRIGRQWRTFARRTLDRRGLARIEHRFKVTFQRITYRFRAVTLKRKRFPFDDARSRPVAVRVN